MQNPTLNMDTLARIASFASREAISTLMQANHFLYHEGPKILLRDVVVLQNHADVLLFLQFMRAEKGTRSRYLAGLAIAPPEGKEEDPMQEETAQMLTQFLITSSFDRLMTLRFEDPEAKITRYPDLLAACKTLSGIECFTLESCDWVAFGPVREIGGGMRRVTLAYPSGKAPWSPHDKMPDFSPHPLLLLQRSRDTLEALEITLMPDHWILPQSLYPPPFPKVRKLTISWSDYRSLSPYIHAFPNLRHLELNETFDEDDERRSEALAPYRQANQADQCRQGSWSLDELSADVADVYVSGLACRVGHLVLGMHNETFEMLENVISDICPSRLSLYVYDRVGVFDKALGIPGVLVRSGGKELIALRLEVRISPDDRDLDIPRALVRIPCCIPVCMHG